MSNACPISYEKVDATIVRLGSISVSFLLLLFIATDLVFFIYILLFDVFVRILRKNRLSPIWNISQVIKELFKLPSKSEDAGAKRFTLYLAFGFSVTVAILALLGYYKLSLVVATLFVICSLTEAILGFCVGCKMYQVIKLFSEEKGLSPS